MKRYIRVLKEHVSRGHAGIEKLEEEKGEETEEEESSSKKNSEESEEEEDSDEENAVYEQYSNLLKVPLPATEDIQLQKGNLAVRMRVAGEMEQIFKVVLISN